MISWIQRTFQQHFKAVFGVLLAVTIISFIITIGATPGIGRGDRAAESEDFFGHNLASQAERAQIIGDATLSIELRLGYNPADEDQLYQYGLQRVAALKLADDLHLPAPALDSDPVRDFIRSLRAFAGANGEFDPQRYAEFQASLANSQTSEADVARVIVDDVRIEQVRGLIAGPGYIQPADVREELLRTDTSWTVATAQVQYASFHPDVPVTTADLLKYYQANAARYTIPQEVSADYVDFPAARYLRQVQVTPAEVRAYYDQDPSRFPKPPAPASPKSAIPSIKSTPDADFAAVRSQVEAALRLERAKALAAKAASDFAFGLYENKVASGRQLDAYLAAHGLKAHSLAPFSASAGPAELGGGQALADAAFRLDSDRFYSEAQPTPGGYVVLLWKALLPAHQPQFVEVEAKVRVDYVQSQRLAKFAALGDEIRSQIAADMKAHRTFEQAATAAALTDHVTILAKAWPPFTLREPPKDLNAAVLPALDSLNPGQLSALIPTSTDGYLVYAIAKKTPDLSPTSPRFVQLRTELDAMYAQRTAGEYLTQLVQNELARAKAAVP